MTNKTSISVYARKMVAVYADDEGDPGTPGVQIAAYEYDGQNRRIEKTTFDGEGDPVETRHYYFNEGWQMLEERIGESTDAAVQYVWDLSYIDSPILRDRDTDADGDLDETLYYAWDANRNVTALVNVSGTVVERYVYAAYGQTTVLESDWSADGDNASDFGNEKLYCGYQFDPETGLYHVRYRPYHPTLGQWISRDPAGYVDGANVYQYVRSSPMRASDSLGLGTWWDSGLVGYGTLSVKIGYDIINCDSCNNDQWQKVRDAIWDALHNFDEAADDFRDLVKHGPVQKPVTAQRLRKWLPNGTWKNH